MSLVVKAEFVVEPVFQHLQEILNPPCRRPAIVEVGQHDGRHSAMLRLFCNVPPIFLGIEPDPRNLDILHSSGWNPAPFAAAERSGMAPLRMSNGTTPEGVHGWSASSSLQEPTEHLRMHPWCTFKETRSVRTDTLDNLTEGLRKESGIIDLIWCDVQGAQRRVLAGAAETLKVTRYLYIECHPIPMYDGEPTGPELAELLPGWDVVQAYESDILFRNISLTR